MKSALWLRNLLCLEISNERNILAFSKQGRVFLAVDNEVWNRIRCNVLALRMLLWRLLQIKSFKIILTSIIFVMRIAKTFRQ